MTPTEKGKATREANKKRKAAWQAAQANIKGDRTKALETVEKLGNLTIERGATPAEAANALEKMAAVQAKADALRNPCAPPDMPRTMEELLAIREQVSEERRRKHWRNRAKQHDNKTETNVAPLAEIEELKADVIRLKAENEELFEGWGEARDLLENAEQPLAARDNEADNVIIAQLRTRIAELEAQLAARNETETKLNGEAKPKNKGGRPCLGDRPMTGYERLKAYRARQREAS